MNSLSSRWSVVVAVCLAALVGATAPASPSEAAQEGAQRDRTPPTPQTRPHSSRVAVDPSTVDIDDGDTVVVRWPNGDVETVRILGIDAPETRHPAHDLPYGQPFGEEARAFGVGVFASNRRVELVRAATLDPFGRTLGYFFVDGQNYSVLIVRARLAEETVS
nr:thermonuclease family protein [Vicinamibacterales bacterium]